MQTAARAWAMRTSRDHPDHVAYVRRELGEGRLRQGWGSHPEQDLRLVAGKMGRSGAGWSALSPEEQGAWGHWRMLGEAAPDPDDALRIGDLVLVPNLPEDGLFTLCRLTGPYDFRIDPAIGDLGHVRAVEVLTPQGVNFRHSLVDAPLARSLRCRSRLWWLGDHMASLAAILAEAKGDRAAQLSQGSNHVARADAKVGPVLSDSLDGLVKGIERPLRQALQSAEWETVLREALAPLVRGVEVKHTGGPNEKGADLEVHIPNPFEPDEPWVIAMQVKDYGGEVGPQVIGQLEQAILARQDPAGETPGQAARGAGRLVAVVLASTEAAPSAALKAEMRRLSVKHGVPVDAYGGAEVMRALARGLAVRSWSGQGRN